MPPSDVPLPPSPPAAPQDEWARAANQVAKALADAISAVDNNTNDGSSNNKEDGSGGSQQQQQHHHHEPVTEIRDGVEWVSFVYSHHRILRRYCIRTDLDKVDIQQLDDKFKRDNCVSNASCITIHHYHHHPPFFHLPTLAAAMCHPSLGAKGYDRECV